VAVDLSLAHGCQISAAQRFVKRAEDPGQEVVGGEEDEGPPLGYDERPQEILFQERDKGALRRFRKVVGDTDEGLAFVVERRVEKGLRDPLFLQQVNSGHLLQIVESLTHGKGRGGNNHGPEFVQDCRFDGFSHLDRRRAEPESHPPAAPVHLEPAA